MSKHILIGVSGGIAAYKTCELVRLLKKQGHEVSVAMSRAATEFISPLTFQALSGRPVLLETHQNQDHNAMAHINLTRQADVFLIAPASMNTIAKIAHGIADNLLSNLAAARKCPLAVAPAMNVEMWHNAANQRNIQQLLADGIHVFQPNHGEQACGEIGMGRMLEADELAERLPDLWSDKILAGKNILISAGASFERIDPVRGITNLSSGQMGVALAQACRAAGAKVTLVHGQMQTALPSGMHKTIQAISANEMYHNIMQEIHTQDVFISVAAVADYRVANASEHKIKKQHNSLPCIELIENPDILASVARLNPAPFCVGFAAESEHVLEHARQKRLRKNIPMLIANDVAIAMGQSVNQITILDDEGECSLPQSDKYTAAQAIIQRLAVLLSRQQA